MSNASTMQEGSGATAAERLLYTPEQAAHALGIGRSTLYVLLADGSIPSVRIGRRRRIPVDGLRRYVASLVFEPTTSTITTRLRGSSEKRGRP